MTVKDLADKIDGRVKDVLAKLLTKRLGMTINSPLDTETATMLSREFGADWGGASDPHAGGESVSRGNMVRAENFQALRSMSLTTEAQGSTPSGCPAVPAGEP